MPFIVAGGSGFHVMPEPIDETGAVTLDLTGLKCPLPALRTRKALRTLAPGTRLIVCATDPLAGLDIPNTAREEGARIEERSRRARTSAESDQDGTVWRFVLRSAG